jgi:dolichol-phosphate mannosyltransferase
MSRLSAIVPCYNGEAGVHELHRRLSAACKAAVGGAYELIYVNDGSTDGTLARLHELAALDAHVVVVNLTRNFGHQLALSAGLTVCRNELVFVLDDDLQDPPELLTPMLQLIEEGADVVYGQRRARAGESAFKKASAAAFYRLLDRMSAVRVPLDTGDFRLMTRRVVDALNAMPEQHRFMRGMVSWVGFRQVPLLYDRDVRYSGETKYSLRKLITLAIDALTGFSVIPLRLSMYLGIFGAVVSFAVLLYSVVSYFLMSIEPGWTSIISVVLFVGSVNMIMLGIMGEYIGRIFMQSKQRPLFLIESVTRGTGPGDPRSTPARHVRQPAEND